jgi:hypothetical protein
MKSQLSLLLLLNLIIINTSHLYAQKNIKEVEEIVSEIRLYYNKINANINEDQSIFRREITSSFDVAPGQGSKISELKKIYPCTSYENPNDTFLIKTERNSQIGQAFYKEERVFYDTSSTRQLKGTKLNSRTNYGLIFYYSKEENPGGTTEYRAYFSNNKLIKLNKSFQSGFDDSENENKTYYDEYEFDKIIKPESKLYKIIKEINQKNEELYSKKEVEEIVSEIRKIYNYRKKNLDCATEMYPCKAEYSQSYLAPGCGNGFDNITWFVSNDGGEYHDTTLFIMASANACAINFQKEYLLSFSIELMPYEITENFKYLNYESEDFRYNNDLLFYYQKEGLDSELRAYYYKGQLIKIIFEDKEHYYPFENLDYGLKNLKIPKRPNP